MHRHSTGHTHTSARFEKETRTFTSLLRELTVRQTQRKPETWACERSSSGSLSGRGSQHTATQTKHTTSWPGRHREADRKLNTRATRSEEKAQLSNANHPDNTQHAQWQTGSETAQKGEKEKVETHFQEQDEYCAVNKQC